MVVAICQDYRPRPLKNDDNGEGLKAIQGHAGLSGTIVLLNHARLGVTLGFDHDRMPAQGAR